MKVQELIKLLQECPADAECMAFEFEAADFVPIVAIEHDTKDVRKPVFFKTDWDLAEEQGS